MTNRSPTIAADAPLVLVRRHKTPDASLPHWTQSLPLAELLILVGVAMVLAAA